MDNREIYGVTKKILFKLSNQLETPAGRAWLAKLRHSIGKDLSQSIEIWPIVFENIPEEYLSNGKTVSYEEKAIIYALQMYALHQQGRQGSVLLDDKTYNNIGTALRVLRTIDNKVSIDRRFNTMITSTIFEELIHHLRHLIAILKSKSKDTKIDYAKLAEDLYWYQMGFEEKVRLSWARAYYKTITATKEGEMNNEQ